MYACTYLLLASGCVDIKRWHRNFYGLFYTMSPESDKTKHLLIYSTNIAKGIILHTKVFTCKELNITCTIRPLFLLSI